MTNRIPPGPRPRGWLGSLPMMRDDPLRLLTESVRDYGEVVQYRMANRRVILLADPHDVRHVLQENYLNYSKATPGFRVLRTFLANGLLTNEGEAWRAQRRTIQPAFHRARIAGFGQTMTAAADDLAHRWETGAPERIDLTAAMMRLTLRIVGETLLSTDVTHEADRVGHALSVALQSARRAITTLVEIPQWVPTPANRRLNRALAELDHVVFDMIAARRSDGVDRGDLLSMLMQAQDEETGESMTDQQLRDEVMTIFLAGHETTALALTWTWFLLSTHPAVAARLRDELSAVLAGRVPTVDDLPRLVYTEQVIKESMRLYPPAWVVSRCAIGDDVVGGYPIGANTIVFVSPYATHRLARLWENPEGFDPDRFAPDRASEIVPFAYFPFGGGPRQCIGNTFAMMEMVLVVATIAQRCRLDLEAGAHPGLSPGITLRPSGPITVYAHRLGVGKKTNEAAGRAGGAEPPSWRSAGPSPVGAPFGPSTAGTVR